MHKLLFHHHHKYQELDPLIRSVSRVTVALSNDSSVFQLFSFHVIYSGMISRGFGRVSFHSICVPIGHHDRSYRVTVPYGACIKCDLLKMRIYGSKHVEECNIV
jgi:hypothetical protein